MMDGGSEQLIAVESSLRNGGYVGKALSSEVVSVFSSMKEISLIITDEKAMTDDSYDE